MKKYAILSLMVVFVLALTTVMSGCGGDAAPTTAEPEEAQGEEMKETVPDSEDTLTDILSDDYEDALSARNQLALGTLKLEESGNAVTPEQAQELALYWQALKAMAADSTSATEETTAVQAQTVEAMTQVQLEAIAAMQLTSADLNEFYVEQGVELTTPEPGVTPQGGNNSGLSTEEKEAARATAEALGTPVGTGGGGGGDGGDGGDGGGSAERKNVLLDTLIELLGQRVEEAELPALTGEVSIHTACPLGLVNDPYPSECKWYVDANGNGICDLSEPELVASGAVAPPAMTEHLPAARDGDSVAGTTNQEEFPCESTSFSSPSFCSSSSWASLLWG